MTEAKYCSGGLDLIEQIILEASKSEKEFHDFLQEYRKMKAFLDSIAEITKVTELCKEVDDLLDIQEDYHDNDFVLFV